MNEIEKLNERIAQLTNLVKSGEETIFATKEMLKLAEQERDRLADQWKEQEPKFERVREKEKYYLIDFGRYKGFMIKSDTEVGHPLDKALYDTNNYFRTEKRAQEVADKINFLLKLERLHDIYCPDYVPDWNDGKWKYFVVYDNICKHYGVDSSINVVHRTNVFFATRDIAQKACDILNTELRKNEENCNE